MLNQILERVTGADLDRALGLYPAVPDVALSLERHHAALIRVKRPRRGRPVLEQHYIVEEDLSWVPAALFDTNSGSAEELEARLRRLFDRAGIRPGKLSLILPDNVAKISLMSLPERPPSRRQLDQIVRFRMRRTVPFKLDEAAISSQVLGPEGAGLAVLVSLVRRALVERFEQALEAFGARPGLIDLVTPNLLNACRAELDTAAADGSDVALLNLTGAYFSLVIVRQGRVIFFRCKSFAASESDPLLRDAVLLREMASSLSYHQEKLGGRSIGTLLVRAVDATVERLGEPLRGLGVAEVRSLDPTTWVECAANGRLDPESAQRLAPAIGATIGRLG